MPKLTKRLVDAAETSPGRILRLGQRDPRLRPAGAAERAQGLRGPVSRRTTLAADQPRAQHCPDLRAGAQPGHHHRCRRAQRRGSSRRARRRAQGDHGEGTGRAVRQGAHRDPREGQHGEGVSPEPAALHPTRARPTDGHGHHTGGRGEVPPRPPPHPLSGEPLPRSGLEDVQPLRDVGPTSGRHQSAQAHPEIPRGKARALPRARPNCAGSARCCARWRPKGWSCPRRSLPRVC